MSSLRNIFLTLILLLPLALIGSSKPLIRSLTVADGLSDQLVNAIYKDSLGYVWFGTGTALDRFDGNHLKRYPLPGNVYGPQRVNAIAELRKGEIFVGNPQGIFVLSPGSDALRPAFADKINFQVNALAADNRGNLYIGTQYGIFRYNVFQNSLKQTLLKSDILSHGNEVTDLWIDGEEGLWISSFHGLYHLDFETEQIESFPYSEVGPIMHIRGHGDRIYLGTHGSGIVPFDKKSHTFLPPIEIGNNIITSLATSEFYPGNNLYVSTDGEGLFCYSLDENRVDRHFTTHPSSAYPLRSNSVYSMFIDERGLVWVGYYQGGVDYTLNNTNIFAVYDYPGFVDTHNLAVRAFALGKGEKVIGSRDGLFYIDEARGRTAKFIKPQIRSNIIFAITPHQTNPHLYYIGTYNGGMYLLNTSTLSISPFSPSSVGTEFADASVFAIVHDAYGNLWVGTSLGLFRFKDDKEVAHYTTSNSHLPEGNVYEIFFDSAGRGWICTENGMAIWNGRELVTDRFPKGFIDKVKVRDIYEDRDHTLYFAPDRGEIFTSNISLTEFGPLDREINPSSNVTTFIIEDNDGWIWFGGENGLVRYNKKDRFSQFNNADGMPHLVFTLCPPVRDAEGNLWMGNTQGLIKLDFQKFRPLQSYLHPRVWVTDLHSDGKSILARLNKETDAWTVDLRSDEDNLSLEFSNFSYIPSEHLNAEYRLEGVSDTWTPIKGSKEINLYNLPSGTHRLIVRLAGDPFTESVLDIHKPLSFSVLGGVICLILFFIVVGGAAIIILKRRRDSASETTSTENGSGSGHQRESYVSSAVPAKECRRLLKLLDEVMHQKKPYTDPNLKIANLAAMIGTTSYTLSYLFNQYLNKNYYDYLNEFRIAEFKRIVRESDISRFTLLALAEKCGFSSRSTFFRHFKNQTGITPAEYIKAKKG